MAVNMEPTGERIYDPFSGEERDAFPGEVVDPKNETTMQRLMRQEEEKFLEMFRVVKETGEMSEDEMNAIRKAGRILAEQKRKEYLEQIKSNPAVILRSILVPLLPKFETNAINTGLRDLDGKIRKVKSAVTAAQSSDRVAGKELRPTSTYINIEINKENRSDRIIDTYYGDGIGTRTDISEPDAIKILQEMQALPSEDSLTINRIRGIIKAANNEAGSGKPRLEGVSVYNLAALRPGLEGVFVNLMCTNNGSIFGLNIRGDINAWVRILEAEGISG